MKLYATELEVDLTARGLDIHDWHLQTRAKNGTLVLSSRRLIAIAKSLLILSTTDSLFRKAASSPDYTPENGDWSHAEHIAAAAVNEARLSRVDQAALSGRNLDYALLESPVQERMRMKEVQERQQIRTRISKQLNRGP